MNWTVRFIDYPQQYQKMRSEILATIDTMLTQGDVMLRQQLDDFETDLASFVGTKYAVGTSNCTDALHLTLRAAGIGPGDEVITVSHTFVATAAAIHHAGATPVLIDIGDDHNMNVDLIEAAITPRTKALMPVHLNGRVCNMARVMAIAEDRNLLVIEDAAQALDASFQGTKGGAFGLAGCFSFYPAKLLGTYGDAGAMVTNNADLAEQVKLLRNHGRLPDGGVSGWSYNCRMDNMHAALLSLKLKRVPEWIGRRREIAGLYHQRLAGLEQLHLPPPPIESGPFHDVFQNYEVEAQERDQLVAYLKEKGVEVMLPWGGKGVHQFPTLGLTHFNLPRTERMFRDSLLLPLHTELNDEHVQYVCDTVEAFYQC